MHQSLNSRVALRSLLAALSLLWLSACGTLDSDAGDDAETSTATDTAQDAPTVPLDIPSDAEPLTLQYVPDGEGFLRMPWPSDHRKTAAGTLDFSDFPNVEIGLISDYRAEIESQVFGFPIMPVMYVQMDENPGTGILPTPALTVQDPQAPLQLVNVSANGCGQRIPLNAQISEDGFDDPYLPPNVLQVAPADGFVLQQGTPYAFVILRNFGLSVGKTARRPDAFDAAWKGGTDSPLSASFEPLRDCLPRIGFTDGDIALATVFTTQDARPLLRRLRETVVDPNRLETPQVTNWRLDEGEFNVDGFYRSYTASFRAPIFQEGETPYTDEGGRLVLDSEGRPAFQRWEEAPMIVTVPEVGSAPYPIFLYVPGTGASAWGHLRNDWVRDALAEGFVVVSVLPQFHGGRGGPMANEELNTYNFLNPPAARGNFIQQALELMYFLRMVREVLPNQPGLPLLDTSKVVYGGHSQGTQPGAILAAIEPEVRAFAFNGQSSYLSHTIVDRKDITDFELLIKLAARIDAERELDRFHPIIQYVQVAADLIDTHSFITLWTGWDGNPTGNHVFVINGYNDDTTTPPGMNHLTIAADLPPLNTSAGAPGWDPDDTNLWMTDFATAPVSGNRTSVSGRPLTFGTFLDFEQGHFTIFRKAVPRAMAISFFKSAITDDPNVTPVIPAE